MLKNILLLAFFSLSLFSFAQKKYETAPFTVKQTQEKIKVDGVLDEPVWQDQRVIEQFWQYFPSDTIRAKYPTEILMTYDDRNLYVAAKCFSPANKYVITSYRRDFRAGGNDNISLVFDTFNDKTNAFLFGMNPEGVTREALISNGGSDNENFNAYWDNKWQGEAKIYENYWTCELAIPFTTLRFKDGSQNWNFMAYRFDTQSNETTTYVRTPQNQLIFNLAFVAPMVFDKPLKKPKTNISLIPYLAGRSSQDFENPKNPSVGNKVSFGADAKIGLTPSLNLDLTVNPDFSNVEADRQVTNLSRFDITYPEQRQFFLENSDLFTGFGSYITNPFVPPSPLGSGSGTQIVSPFFSRRVGIAQDTVTGLSVQNRLLYGARLSGKIDDNWRVGLLNTQTAEDEFRGISGANFTVASLQRKLFSRSNISGIFVNKQTLNPEIGKGLSSFNRVAGLEYNLASKDNRWQGKSYYHQVFTPIKQKDAFANGLILRYSVLKYTIQWSHDWVGNGYDAEVGFVPRKNFFHINPTVGFSFYPRTKYVNRYSVGIAYDQYSSPNLGLTDRQAGPFISMAFQNTARLLLTLNQNFTYLFSDFDALRSNRLFPSLKKGTSYTYYNLSANYTSDTRKKLFISTQPVLGQYFDGNIISLVGAATYRFQPYGSLAMNFNYNKISLSTGKNSIYLVGPKLDVSFTKSLFWTTYVQYNSQFDNLNVNSRVQWRFAPVSDFFLVYTDNYNSNTWLPKNRAILAKITYWLNV